MVNVDDSPERRKYYPEADDVPLSTAIQEAIEAHEHESLTTDEFELFQHVNPEAIDMLFTDEPERDVNISVQFNLDNVTVSVWSDGAIDIRVSDRME